MLFNAVSSFFFTEFFVFEQPFILVKLSVKKNGFVTFHGCGVRTANQQMAVLFRFRFHFSLLRHVLKFRLLFALCTDVSYFFGPSALLMYAPCTEPVRCLCLLPRRCSLYALVLFTSFLQWQSVRSCRLLALYSQCRSGALPSPSLHAPVGFPPPHMRVHARGYSRHLYR